MLRLKHKKKSSKIILDLNSQHSEYSLRYEDILYLLNHSSPNKYPLI